VHSRSYCLIHLRHSVNHVDGVIIAVLLESKRDFLIYLVQLVNLTLFRSILTCAKVLLTAFASLGSGNILSYVRGCLV
jgi:hypothetical protein